MDLGLVARRAKQSVKGLDHRRNSCPSNKHRNVRVAKAECFRRIVPVFPVCNDMIASHTFHRTCTHKAERDPANHSCRIRWVSLEAKWVL